MKAIVAVDNTFGIGVGNDLAIRNKNDLNWFKMNTVGELCFAGANTYPSVKNLSNRTVERYTRDTYGELIRTNPELYTEAWVIGGAKTYKELADVTDELYVTFFKTTNPECDVFLNVYEVYPHLKNRKEIFEDGFMTIEHWTR